MAVARSNGDLEKWDFTTGENQTLLKGSFLRVAASRKGHLLSLTSKTSRKVTLYDWKEERIIGHLAEPNDQVGSMAWSPNGDRLALALGNGEVQTWDIPELRQQLAEIGLDWND